MDDNNKSIKLKWCYQFGSTTGFQTRDSIITVTTSTNRTSKNKLNKIWEEMERDNKEFHAHEGVDSTVFLLRMKKRVGNWYERVKEITNSVSIDMKMVLLNPLDRNIRKRIKM